MRYRGTRSKYGAKKVKLDGYTFDSQAEASRYGELLFLQRAGKISDLIVHPKYEIRFQKEKVCDVVLDFRYWEEGEKRYIFEDVKGLDTPMSKLKRKLLKAFYGLNVELIDHTTGG